MKSTSQYTGKILFEVLKSINIPGTNKGISGHTHKTKD